MSQFPRFQRQTDRTLKVRRPDCPADSAWQRVMTGFGPLWSI